MQINNQFLPVSPRASRGGPAPKAEIYKEGFFIEEKQQNKNGQKIDHTTQKNLHL